MDTLPLLAASEETDVNVAALVTLIVVGLAVVPILLGLVALVLAFTWPRSWQIAGSAASGWPLSVFFGLIFLGIVTDTGGEGGPATAILTIFMLPFLAWYLAFAWGGAAIGRLLGVRFGPRKA